MAKTYEVEIVAAISKRIEVVADSKDHAEKLAHEMFHQQWVDGTWKSSKGLTDMYDQDTYEIEEIV